MLAASGGRIEFSTDSEAALKNLQEFITGVETFQPVSSLAATANKIVEADPDFAFGRLAVAIVTPPQQQPPVFQEAVQMAEGASDGERRYIEAMGLLYQQKVEEARTRFEALFRDYPGDRMVAMLMGQIYQNTGRFEQARMYDRKFRISDRPV